MAGTGRRWRKAVLAAALLASLAAGLALHSRGSRPDLPADVDGPDVASYATLGMDRGTTYYFETLRDAHDKRTFGYRYGEDTYLVDKCVDAITRLGAAPYRRLEGEAQVVLLLSDVLVEAPSALVKVAAATSLTSLAARRPAAPAAPVPDRGDRLYAIMKDLDALHDAGGGRRDDSPATRQRVAALVEEMGRLQLRSGDLLAAKNALKFLLTRPFVFRETDPALRDAFDRAMARRMQPVVRESLAMTAANAPR